jgi:hypothetical protein
MMGSRLTILGLDLPQEDPVGGKMHIMQITRHNAEVCPSFHEQNKQSTVALLQRFPALLEKYGIKIVGIWNDHPGHSVYNIYDIPDMQTFMGLSMEPEMVAWLAYNTGETKVVFGPDEIKMMFGLQ